MIVNELCYKNIFDLSYSFSHYIAHSIDYKVHCWGNNYQNQLVMEVKMKINCIKIIQN